MIINSVCPLTLLKGADRALLASVLPSPFPSSQTQGIQQSKSKLQLLSPKVWANEMAKLDVGACCQA